MPAAARSSAKKAAACSRSYPWVGCYDGKLPSPQYWQNPVTVTVPQ